MNIAWIKNLKTKEEQELFKNSLQGNKHILNRLNELIQEKIDEVEMTERSMKAYDNPSWGYLQAHKNGYISAMSAIKQLTTFDNVKLT